MWGRWERGMRTGKGIHNLQQVPISEEGVSSHIGPGLLFNKDFSSSFDKFHTLDQKREPYFF